MVSITRENAPFDVTFPNPIASRPPVVINEPDGTRSPRHDLLMPRLDVDPRSSTVRFSNDPSFVGDSRIQNLVPRNHPALTQRIKRLMPRLWTIILSKGLQSGLYPRCAVDVETDREEELDLPVLRVYLDTGAAQALAFWDGLDADLDRWLGHLSKDDRLAVQRDFGLRIHWASL